jgi:hypothetical protein
MSRLKGHKLFEILIQITIIDWIRGTEYVPVHQTPPAARSENCDKVGSRMADASICVNAPHGLCFTAMNHEKESSG